MRYEDDIEGCQARFRRSLERIGAQRSGWMTRDVEVAIRPRLEIPKGGQTPVSLRVSASYSALTSSSICTGPEPAQ